MKFPFTATIEKLKVIRNMTKEQIYRTFENQASRMKQDVCYTIVTKNPKDTDIGEYIGTYRKSGTEWKFPCYNVEYIKSGDQHMISIYLHIVPGSHEVLWHSIMHDPVTKKQFPDMLLGMEIIDKKKEVESNAETKLR